MEKKQTKIKLDRKMFIKKLDKFQDHYTVNPKPLGKGTYGEVYLCMHRITKEVRAVKTISKHNMQNVDDFLHEIECLKNLVLLIKPNQCRTIQT